MIMYNLDQLLKTFFKTENYTKEKLDKGLTNDNYLITVDRQRFVLRVPKSDANHIVQFAHEAKALNLVKKIDLDVNTLYYDQNTGIKITQYVDDFITFNEYQSEDRIIRVAHLMKRLHGLKQTIGYNFDPLARYQQYRSNVKHALIDDYQASNLIDEFKKIPSIPTLCHNDWVSGNIGFSQHKDYLIDYEYAGDNDPYFDVMSFLTENTLTSQERECFINAYFDHPLTATEKICLSVYEDFHNLLWCTWAEMMFEHRQDDVYRQIAQTKLNQFNTKKTFE